MSSTAESLCNDLVLAAAVDTLLCLSVPGESVIRELVDSDDMSKGESPLMEAEPGVEGASLARRGEFSKMIETRGR